jgi:hypothetical protein
MSNKTKVEKQTDHSQGAPAQPDDSMPAPQKGHIGKDKTDSEPTSGQH